VIVTRRGPFAFSAARARSSPLSPSRTILRGGDDPAGLLPLVAVDIEGVNALNASDVRGNSRCARTSTMTGGNGGGRRDAQRGPLRAGLLLSPFTHHVASVLGWLTIDLELYFNFSRAASSEAGITRSANDPRTLAQQRCSWKKALLRPSRRLVLGMEAPSLYLWTFQIRSRIGTHLCSHSRSSCDVFVCFRPGSFAPVWGRSKMTAM
jgi:hypothetical protein